MKTMMYNLLGLAIVVTLAVMANPSLALAKEVLSGAYIRGR